MLVGYLNPLKITCAFRLGSTNAGPLGEGRPTSGYLEDKAFARLLFVLGIQVMVIEVAIKIVLTKYNSDSGV
jgi:hypothetical protein